MGSFISGVGASMFGQNVVASTVGGVAAKSTAPSSALQIKPEPLTLTFDGMQYAVAGIADNAYPGAVRIDNKNDYQQLYAKVTQGKDWQQEKTVGMTNDKNDYCAYRRGDSILVFDKKNKTVVVVDLKTFLPKEKVFGRDYKQAPSIEINGQKSVYAFNRDCLQIRISDPPSGDPSDDLTVVVIGID